MDGTITLKDGNWTKILKNDINRAEEALFYCRGVF